MHWFIYEKLKQDSMNRWDGIERGKKVRKEGGKKRGGRKGMEGGIKNSHQVA